MQLDLVSRIKGYYHRLVSRPTANEAWSNSLLIIDHDRLVKIYNSSLKILLDKGFRGI